MKGQTTMFHLKKCEPNGGSCLNWFISFWNMLWTHTQCKSHRNSYPNAFIFSRDGKIFENGYSSVHLRNINYSLCEIRSVVLTDFFQFEYLPRHNQTRTLCRPSWCYFVRFFQISPEHMVYCQFRVLNIGLAVMQAAFRNGKFSLRRKHIFVKWTHKIFIAASNFIFLLLPLQFILCTNK